MLRPHKGMFWGVVNYEYDYHIKPYFVWHGIYSGPPLIRPHVGDGQSGLIREVASREGYSRYNYRGIHGLFSEIVAS